MGERGRPRAGRQTRGGGLAGSRHRRGGIQPVPHTRYHDHFLQGLRHRGGRRGPLPGRGRLRYCAGGDQYHASVRARGAGKLEATGGPAEQRSRSLVIPGSTKVTGGLPRWVGYLTKPVLLGLACLSLYLWVSGLELDSIEQRELNAETITQYFIDHLKLTALATLAVVVLAVSAGVLLTRPFARRVSPI